MIYEAVSREVHERKLQRLRVFEDCFGQSFTVVAATNLAPAVASFVVNPGYSVDHQHDAARVPR